MGREKVATTEEIASGQGKLFSVGGRAIAVFNVSGAYHAIDNTCPHRGGPLAEGSLDGSVVTCPWHGWGFDVTTGECKLNDAVKQETFPCAVEGNDVFIDV